MPSADPIDSSPATEASPDRISGSADLIFDALYGAGFGGSTIALFFLVTDSLAGQPLFTPSLIGTVLFTDAAAAAVTETRLDMVAFYSIVHFFAFGTLGAVASRACRWSGLMGGHVLVVAAVIFAMLTAALLAADFLVMPGVVGAIGTGLVLAANAATAVVMALFLRWSHQAD